MPQDFISLRKPLTGAVADLLTDEKMACVQTQDGLVTVINALSLYREEGRALFPEVFVLDDLKSVLAVLPHGESIEIGRGPRNAATMASALKRCAPLANGGWAVYIHRQAAEFIYGLFRCGIHVLSARISDLLVEKGDTRISALMVRQVAENVVELRGVGGSSLLAHFGAARVNEVSPVTALKSLVAAIVADVNIRIKEQAYAFLETLVGSVLKASHGTLAVVQSAKATSIPTNLRDGILLQKPVRISDSISELVSKSDCLANTRLVSAGELISGMLLSDGITIFGSDGSVRAYNVFVKHSLANSTPRVGGARRRTFETLSSMTGTQLTFAFMQSQDGGVDYSPRGSHG